MYIKSKNPEVNKLFACYMCLRTNHPIGYFSTPVTTGIRYYEWLVENKDKTIPGGKPPVEEEQFKNYVFYPNIKDATEILNTLTINGDVIINPTSVGIIPGWMPEDYAHLWRHVIEFNVNYLIFNNGWSYSDGCVYEFYVAQINGKRCQTIKGTEISFHDGLENIKSSLLYIQSFGFTSEMLVSVISEWENKNANY